MYDLDFFKKKVLANLWPAKLSIKAGCVVLFPGTGRRVQGANYYFLAFKLHNEINVQMQPFQKCEPNMLLSVGKRCTYCSHHAFQKCICRKRVWK